MFVIVMGTNGSGKTSLAKHLLGDWVVKERVFREHEKIDRYRYSKGREWTAFGPYGEERSGGGADPESKQFALKLEDFIKQAKIQSDKVGGHFLVEGFMLNRAKWVKLAAETFGNDFKSVILTADYDVILDRLEERNGGVRKPYKRVEENDKVITGNMARHLRNLSITHLILNTTDLTWEETCETVDNFIRVGREQ